MIGVGGGILLIRLIKQISAPRMWMSKIDMKVKKTKPALIFRSETLLRWSPDCKMGSGGTYSHDAKKAITNRKKVETGKMTIFMLALSTLLFLPDNGVDDR